MTLPKARSNANYISLGYTAAAAVCKSRVMIPLELPAHKSGSPLCGPDATTVLVCTGVRWKHFLGSSFSEWRELAGSNREVVGGNLTAKIPCDVPVQLPQFFTGTMCSTTIFAGAGGSRNYVDIVSRFDLFLVKSHSYNVTVKTKVHFIFNVNAWSLHGQGHCYRPTN